MVMRIPFGVLVVLILVDVISLTLASEISFTLWYQSTCCRCRLVVTALHSARVSNSIIYGKQTLKDGEWRRFQSLKLPSHSSKSEEKERWVIHRSQRYPASWKLVYGLVQYCLKVQFRSGCGTTLSPLLRDNNQARASSANRQELDSTIEQLL